METGCGYPLPPMRQQAKTRELRTNGLRPGTADWVLLAALTPAGRKTVWYHAGPVT